MSCLFPDHRGRAETAEIEQNEPWQICTELETINASLTKQCKLQLSTILRMNPNPMKTTEHHKKTILKNTFKHHHRSQ